MSEELPNYRVEELTGDEQMDLVKEVEHHQQPSCQSVAVSQGESDLSLRKEEATE
jgi:hypothetical protein